MRKVYLIGAIIAFGLAIVIEIYYRQTNIVLPKSEWHCAVRSTFTGCELYQRNDTDDKMLRDYFIGKVDEQR